MSKYLEIGASGGVAAMLIVAYNFADRLVTPMPPLPDRSKAIAAYTAPPPSPMMAAVAAGGTAAKFGLGRRALPEEIAAWNLDVSPDGTGLPEGSGDVFTGETVFEENCAVCHGSFAEGVDNWPKLAGGRGTLADADPLKTVGSYWPHPSTAWDYINRSMPFGNAQTLTPDEVYSIVAYILYSNDLVDDDFELSHENFAEFELPNAGGFFDDDRSVTEYPAFSSAPCMQDCKDGVEITMRAAVLDVTPEDTGVSGAAAPLAAEDAPEQLATITETVVEGVDEAINEQAAADPALIAAGEIVFKKCAACHQVGEGAKNRVGPHLNDVIGRTVASVDGFRYSTALDKLAADGVAWDTETLAGFLTDPKAFASGTRMSFRGLNKPEDRAAITAYLATFGHAR